MTVHLRDYQLAAVEGVRNEIRAGHRAVILCSSTGSGKTKTATSGIVLPSYLKGKRVLWVAALRELLDQAADAMVESGIPRDAIGYVVGPEKKRNKSAPIQIASQQTLCRRPVVDADVVIIDECHLSLAKTYERSIWDNPYKLIVGLTATPCLGDRRGLGSKFNAIVNVTSYANLIADGFINQPIVYAPKVKPNARVLEKSGGEYTPESAAESMGGLAGNIVDTWLEKAEGRPTIMFASTIEHSKDLVERFRAAGVAVEHLDGETPAIERMRIIQDLRVGKIQMVSNVNVLTAGFDAPNVRCVIVARPTMSFVFHRQTSGRCLRPGTVQPLIFDFANNVAEHGLPTMDVDWTLDGKQKKGGEGVSKTCGECFAYIPGGCKVCPHCGAEMTVAEKKPPVEDDTIEMKLVTQLGLQQDYFTSMGLKAMQFGYRPGWVCHQYKTKFGDNWPPWDWKVRLEEEFASNTDWQERVASQTARRERFRDAGE